MKNIKHFFIIVAICGLWANRAAAQGIPFGQVKFDVGLEGGVPTQSARQLSGVMGGATGRFQLGLGDYLTVTATSGFYNFFDKTSHINGAAIQEPGLGVVPVKVGLKGYLGNSGIYLIGEVGQGYETSRDADTRQKDDKNLAAAGIGYAYHHWDYGVHYDYFSGQNFDYGIIALRVAYGFKL